MSDSTVIRLKEAKSDLIGMERRSNSRTQPVHRPLVHLLVKPSFFSVRAFLHDVSPTGIGFVLNRPLKPGSRLAFQLRNDQRGNTRIQSARVAHVTPQPGGLWLVGCECSPPLAGEELCFLLGRR